MAHHKGEPFAFGGGAGGNLARPSGLAPVCASRSRSAKQGFAKPCVRPASRGFDPRQIA